MFTTLLFKLEKDQCGTHADSLENPVIKALPLLKKWYPELTIACDVSNLFYIV